MAKSWLLGHPAEVIDANPAQVGTIVRTFRSATASVLMVVIQVHGGHLVTVDASAVHVLDAPSGK